MLTRILDPDQKAVLAEVRSTLTEAVAVAAELGWSAADVARLRDALAGLDGLFLVVVAGEFNSGKSAVINALLGDRLLDEGITPTTSTIHVIEHGPRAAPRAEGPGLVRLTLPVELLDEVTIVDTPGTNALEREHEALTREFIPRSDLVLFVTSSDRPFSESERAFLAGIRDWGKRIVVVLNKIDQLSGDAQVAELMAYIREHAERLLGIQPPILPLSARKAQAARATGDEALAETSGLGGLERFLLQTLDAGERIRLKLASPVGVAEHLLAATAEAIDAQAALLDEDLAALADVDGQLGAWQEDVEREFGFRRGDIDAELHALEVRGHEFLDDTLRLARLADLIRSERIRSQFAERVVAGAPQRIERKVDDLVDWLMETTLAQWQRVVEHVQLRAARHADRIVGHVGAGLETGRSRLLDSVGRAARDAMASYDREVESVRMAEGVQQAVAGTALVEAGAVGLGTAVALIASSTAADVTGLAAAGLLATLGLFIIPAKRARAKREFKEKIAATRAALMDALTTQFRREAEGSVQRIQETIAPYSRFVRAEGGRLAERRAAVGGVRGRLASLSARIARLGGPAG